MNLLETVDKYLENPYRVSPRTPSGGFYPSNASCFIKNEFGEDQCVGKCLRASYWKQKSVAQTNPMNARSIRIATCGKLIEQFEIDNYKEMGIWRGNNCKFYDPDHNISGEMDAFIWDAKMNTIIGVEIKTGYGYEFNKRVMGNTRWEGKPKADHLLQTMIYKHFMKDIPLFKMVYIDRGNAARIEHNVELDKNGCARVNGKMFDKLITIPRIFMRFKELADHLEDNTIPKRNYALQYTDTKIGLMYDAKKLNKEQTRQYEKTKKVALGDWQCSYCEYKDYCWYGEGKND